jgi:hypothetical protein
MTHRRGAILACVAVALLGRDASAQMFVTTGRDTLRGLPGVEVVVEAIQPEVERAGLTEAGIKADVVERLRAGGIVVYASQKENPSPAKPYLYIHVNALALPEQGLYAVAVQVHLRQTLQSPVTSSNVVNAMTWDAHNVVGVPAASLPDVQEEVREYVDQFLADWKAVQVR